MTKTLKPVWTIVDICGEKLQAVRPTRKQAREWNHEHNYGLGTIVKYIPAPAASKAPEPMPKPVAVLTDWIPCKTPPVRAGVYERLLADGLEAFQYWNGYAWCGLELTSSAAYRATDESNHQRGKWRGFTTEQA
jgi:hypothetical protein